MYSTFLKLQDFNDKHKGNYEQMKNYLLLERFSVVKGSISSKLTYKVGIILIKIENYFFHRILKLNLKLIQERKYSTNFWKTKTQHFANVKIYNKAVIIVVSW